MGKGQATKLGRKVGRSKTGCDRYRTEHRLEKNKIRRMAAMVKNLSPDNKMRVLTEKRIKELTAVVRGY
ncbi:hypothetical protein ES703_39959 [subsurface metagenome]